jgi:hypothetical protein
MSLLEMEMDPPMRVYVSWGLDNTRLVVLGAKMMGQREIRDCKDRQQRKWRRRAWAASRDRVTWGG